MNDYMLYIILGITFFIILFIIIKNNIHKTKFLIALTFAVIVGIYFIIAGILPFFASTSNNDTFIYQLLPILKTLNNFLINNKNWLVPTGCIAGIVDVFFVFKVVMPLGDR